ncbi:kynurenine aminotransferase isoform X2 [Hetaerina americana]|uniref:kynurenine aminotransferase isoform X2 n=1 Tax=Hetaerina americana TaxID=62018 RepID=UPI003A7F5C97
MFEMLRVLTKPAIRRRSHNFFVNSASVIASVDLRPSRSFSSHQGGNMDPKKFALPARYQGQEKSVWVEYIQLALETKPLNLGQGFPDYAPPAYVTQALSDVATGDNVLLNQYTRGFGHPRLVAALSRLYSQLVRRPIDSQTEILVTSGAYEALFSTIQGHVGPGDEVVIIEPYFDCYEPMVLTAGGKPIFVPLRPKTESGVKSTSSADWVLDPDELSSAFNDRTKAIILNTPHNPVGKVFSKKELTLIADLCLRWDALCISDEVYEWLVYPPNEHIRIATLPGMWERTITIGSAGKTFSVTGWKLGWAYGPASLMTNLQLVHQNCVYTCPTPIQEAVARGFELELGRLDSPECFFKSLPAELEAKRDLMANFLADVGMVPTIPQGGYFMIADWSPLASKVPLNQEKDKWKDYRFTKWMSRNLKLQGIPPSAFYCADHKPLGEDFVRYCFIKKDENLHEAAKILKKWKGSSL